MLIEIWERLRGYDKWIQTEAAVQSSHIDEVVVAATRSGKPIYGWQGNEEVSWVDKDGVRQCEPLAVSESSPVFKLYDGNPLVIRYNPASPCDFYVREQLRYQVNLGAKVSLAVLVAAGAILLVVLN
ncbi:MAG: DUF3592 domain-containing protein [Terracidiphilus sp.]